MATHTRKVKVSFLSDKIDTLNEKAADTSPAQRVYGKASAVLTLLRVGSLALWPSVDSHWQPNQDKMIDNSDSVQLSEYCFNMCEALEPAIEGRNADDLNESVRRAFEDLERCVD